VLPVLLPPDAFSRLRMADKCVCGCGSAPDPAGGAYSAPLDPLAGLRGPTSKGRGSEKGGGHRRNFRGYEGYAYPTPTFYKTPSFELKLCRNAWAPGAVPQTLLGELTALPLQTP